MNKQPPTGSIAPKGYVVFDLTITDPDSHEQYRLSRRSTTTRAWGGRVLTGEPAPEASSKKLEGSWPAKRLVINEFPTVAIARSWFRSPEYQPAAAHRQASSTGRVLLVEGWNKPW
jgi:uncharacterized protein (DUF1330 family)